MSDELRRLVQRVRAVPDVLRRFDHAAGEARALCGLDAATLEALAAAGLPARGRGAARRYEFADLHYVGLRLGRARSFLSSIGRWTATLRRLAAVERMAVNVAYLPLLPAADGGIPATVRLLDGAEQAVTLQPRTPAAVLRCEVTNAWPSLPPAAVALGRELADLELYLVSECEDTDLARRTRLANCRLAALLTAEECAAQGLRARTSHGLLLSAPYAIEHDWTEIAVGDRWVPFDPLILNAMRSLGGLDERAWPDDRSIGPLLLRMADAPLPLLDAGAHVRVTFRTTFGVAGRGASDPRPASR